MAAAFVAMNDVYGPVFAAPPDEAADPDAADARAHRLAGQFVMDMHTHFLRDDTRLTGFVAMREAVGRSGWNSQLGEREQTLDDLKYDNYLKEIFLDSDTKLALVSSAPSDIPEDWFLTNAQMAEARARFNGAAGVRNVCVHKGLFAPALDDRFPALRPFADVSDVAQAAKDWPDLNFVIYHAGYRHVGGDPAVARAEFENTGRLDWVTDLAEIPERHGVNNVYADLGQVFASTLIAEPRICAAIMGTLVRGLGVERVCWGTDAIWTGSPQWQIEGLRRLEIPEDMQRRHGFAPLGAADGPVKNAIFGGNNARLYGLDAAAQVAHAGDRIETLRNTYRRAGANPSNLRYGYVAAGRG